MPTLVRAETDERDALLAFLDAQRNGLRRAVLGLTDEQASATPTAGALCAGGLIKHAALVEHHWIVTVLMGGQPSAALPAEWADQFRLLPGETLAQWLAAYTEVAAETERIVNGLPGLTMDATLPESPRFPPGSRRTARWVLLRLIEETTRHAGHADIIRESLDGRTAFELVTAAEAQV